LGWLPRQSRKGAAVAPRPERDKGSETCMEDATYEHASDDC